MGPLLMSLAWECTDILIKMTAVTLVVSDCTVISCNSDINQKPCNLSDGKSWLIFFSFIWICLALIYNGFGLSVFPVCCSTKEWFQKHGNNLLLPFLNTPRVQETQKSLNIMFKLKKKKKQHIHLNRFKILNFCL